MDRERPLVIRGACSDWPLVQAACKSDAAFAMQLAALDNGTPVDTLLMAPEEQGIIGYNARMDGFNCRQFRVSITEALQRRPLTHAMKAICLAGPGAPC